MINSIGELVAFLQHFHRAWPRAAVDAPSIPDDLPSALMTIYGSLGALVNLESNLGRAPFAAQDRLLPLARLKRVEGMFEFAWENQGNWTARCPAGQGDPPVYSNARDACNAEQRGFVQVCDSLDHFLTTLCLQEAVMSCRSLITIDTDIPPDRVLAGPVGALWLNGRYVDEDQVHHFWHAQGGDLIVARIADTTWLGSPSHDVTSLIPQDVVVTIIH